MIGLYTATLFTGAVLLFIVEPMVGKMILPAFGGTPAVWNTCMIFFQALLLAGYAYAHTSTAWLGVRRQAAIHLAVLLLPLALLPIDLTGWSPPPTNGNPTFWLLGRLLVGVGVPFFVVSSSAPLLQRWFAATDHRGAADPYFLYAASNVGSLLALMAYPLVIERLLRLSDQSYLWTVGYGLLIALTGACAVVLWRSARGAQSTPAPNSGVSDAGDPTLSTAPQKFGGEFAVCRAGPSPARSKDAEKRRHSELTGPGTAWLGRNSTPHLWGAVVSSPQAPGWAGWRSSPRAWWVLLSAIPSSLMLGVTTHITTDLAAVPLLWVLPLAIYLLTFVLVFARRPPIRHDWMVRLLPFLLVPMAPLFFARLGRMEWLSVPVHLLLFFTVSMVCHGELVRRRPEANRLTEFYLLMSLGGALGGLFNSLIAPQLFSTVLEYPMVVGLVCFVLPRPAGLPESPRARRLDLLLPAGVLAVVTALAVALGAGPLLRHQQTMMVAFGVLAMICFAGKNRPMRFGLCYAVTLATLGGLSHLQAGTLLHIDRNFFGVKRVLLDPSGSFRTLAHGTTRHGSQSTDPARAGEPLAYYHRSGPIGDVFAALDEAGGAARVGIIGLGTGSVACYARPGQHFTFYEIDPAIERIARDRRYFTFLSDCRGTCEVVLGDGRLTIARAPDHHFSLILLDAFSSDAVPTHLLSREAADLYLSKLENTGLLVFHVSNQYFEFEPLLAGLARAKGISCLARDDRHVTPRQQAEGKRPSHYVAMARWGRSFSILASKPNWHAAVGGMGVVVWTDQYCDIFSLFRAGRRPVAARAGGLRSAPLSP